MSDSTKPGAETQKQKQAQEKRDEVLRGYREALKTGQGLAEAEQALNNYRATLHTMNDTVRQASELTYQQATSTRDLTAAVRLRNNMMTDELIHLQTNLDLTKDKIATIREGLAQENLSKKAIEDMTEKLIKHTKEMHKQRAAVEKATEKQKAFNSITEKTKTIVSALTGISDKWKQTLLGSIAATGGLKQGLLALFAGYQQAFTMGNMVGSTMMKIQESTLKLAMAEDKARVSLLQFNNASEEQVDSTLQAARTNRVLGVSTKELTKVKNELYQTTLTFSSLSDKEANQLAVTMEAMNRFGVSSALAAKNTSFLMDTMGLSSKEVERYQHKLANFASSIGKSLKMVNQELAESMKVITAYGNSGRAVFEKLSATAKALKVQVNQLTGSFENQYNTFEGAFTATGRLNSILIPYGKQLDAMALMHADVADRARMHAEALQGTALAHKALEGPLSKYYLQMIANSMGTSDLDMVTKLLRGDLDKLGESVNYATKSYEEFMSDDFLSKAETQQDMMHKLKLAAEQFGASMMPIIRILTETLTGFNRLLDAAEWLRTGLGYLITAFVVLKTVTMSYFIVAAVWKAITGIATLSLWNNTVAQESNSKSKLRNASATLVTAQAMTAGIPAMIGFGIAAAGVGAAVWMAGMGIREMAHGFEGLGVGQMVGVAVALGLIGVGLYYITPAIIAASKSAELGALGLGLLALAVLAVGAAVAIAAAGMSMMFNSISKITPETGLGILMVSAALGILAGVLVMMGASAILGVVGLGIILPLLGGLGFLMEKMTSPDRVEGLKAFSSLMMTLATTDLESVVNQLERMSKIISEIGRTTMILHVTGASEALSAIMSAAAGGAAVPVKAQAVQPADGATPQQVSDASGQATQNQAGQGSATAVTQESAGNAALQKSIDALTVALKAFKDRPVRLQMTAQGQDEFIAKVREDLVE